MSDQPTTGDEVGRAPAPSGPDGGPGPGGGPRPDRGASALPRGLRPIILVVLLAGMALTLVLAPSTLQAQEGPPGTAPPSGYGAAPPSGPAPPRLFALAAQSSGGGGTSPVWWIVGVLVLVGIVGGTAVFFRLRA